MGIGVFIDPFAAQGFIDICNGYHLGPNGDGISLEVIRISFAIPAFMMMPADFITIVVILFILVIMQILEQFAAANGVGKPCA